MTPDQLRARLVLLPEVTEAEHHGQPDFRVRNKIFTNLDESARTVTVKLTVDDQHALIARRDGAFSLPGGWAKHGWTTIQLDFACNDDVNELAIEAWRQIAHHAIHAQLDKLHL